MDDDDDGDDDTDIPPTVSLQLSSDLAADIIDSGTAHDMSVACDIVESQVLDKSTLDRVPKVRVPLLLSNSDEWSDDPAQVLLEVTEEDRLDGDSKLPPPTPLTTLPFRVEDL